MSRFPHDALKKKVLKALESLGFHIIREKGNSLVPIFSRIMRLTNEEADQVASA